jgi:RNA polymerase sigma factor (sigma-70 family)
MGITNNERDIELWNQFKNGDENAFVTLFKNYYAGLYNYGCRITGHHELVEDCIQELFLEIWRTNGKAKIISIKAYFFTAFKFKLLRLLKHHQKIKALTTGTEENEFELSHENFIINKELNFANRDKILNALQELSPRQKEVIYLKFYQNSSYEEVSEIMQINYQAARNLLYQSVKVLKRIIAMHLIFVAL